MTSDYTYYRYLGNEHYISVDNVTESQMNNITGLGNTHFTITPTKRKIRQTKKKM